MEIQTFATDVSSREALENKKESYGERNSRLRSPVKQKEECGLGSGPTSAEGRLTEAAEVMRQAPRPSKFGLGSLSGDFTCQLFPGSSHMAGKGEQEQSKENTFSSATPGQQDFAFSHVWRGCQRCRASKTGQASNVSLSLTKGQFTVVWYPSGTAPKDQRIFSSRPW